MRLGFVSWVRKIPSVLTPQTSPLRLFMTPWTAARQASLSITNSWSLLKLMFIKSLTDAIQPSFFFSGYYPINLIHLLSSVSK